MDGQHSIAFGEFARKVLRSQGSKAIFQMRKLVTKQSDFMHRWGIPVVRVIK